MKDRNPGEWIRDKDHLCRCFKSASEGPYQYELGENYFCWAGMTMPWTKEFSSRYGAMLIPFSVDPNQERMLLASMHTEEIAGGRILSIEGMRIKLGALRQDLGPDAWRAIQDWLAANMINELDHRMLGTFKTKAEWEKREQQLLAKYHPYAWCKIPNLPPTRWHQIHCFANKIEMLHRADELFIANRPKVAVGVRKNEGAIGQVQSLSKARKDVD